MKNFKRIFHKFILATASLLAAASPVFINSTNYSDLERNTTQYTTSISSSNTQNNLQEVKDFGKENDLKLFSKFWNKKDKAKNLETTSENLKDKESTDLKDNKQIINNPLVPEINNSELSGNGKYSKSDTNIEHTNDFLNSNSTDDNKWIHTSFPNYVNPNVGLSDNEDKKQIMDPRVVPIDENTNSSGSDKERIHNPIPNGANPNVGSSDKDDKKLIISPFGPEINANNDSSNHNKSEIKSFDILQFNQRLKTSDKDDKKRIIEPLGPEINDNINSLNGDKSKIYSMHNLPANPDLGLSDNEQIVSPDGPSNNKNLSNDSKSEIYYIHTRKLNPDTNPSNVVKSDEVSVDRFEFNNHKDLLTNNDKGWFHSSETLPLNPNVGLSDKDNKKKINDPLIPATNNYTNLPNKEKYEINYDEHINKANQLDDKDKEWIHYSRSLPMNPNVGTTDSNDNKFIPFPNNLVDPNVGKENSNDKEWIHSSRPMPMNPDVGNTNGNDRNGIEQIDTLPVNPNVGSSDPSDNRFVPFHNHFANPNVGKENDENNKERIHQVDTLPMNPNKGNINSDENEILSISNNSSKSNKDDLNNSVKEKDSIIDLKTNNINK